MPEKYFLYNNEKLGVSALDVTISAYKPIVQTGKGAILVFAGGGYGCRCAWEDEAYAQFINSMGLMAFVVDCRVYPNQFPDALLDARTAVRFVRKNAELFNIDPQKIAVMGSSAGGHLCALLSTYREPLKNEELTENFQVDYRPSAQVLCYPVILTIRKCLTNRTKSNIMLRCQCANWRCFCQTIAFHNTNTKLFIAFHYSNICSSTTTND